jgi:alkylhydroperoxidase family enzyme
MLGRSVGLSKDKIDQLKNWRTSDVYSDVERIVLEYTEEIVRNIRISDDLFRRLSEHFTTQEIIDLCFISGISGIVNHIHGTFQTDIDDVTCQLGVVKESVDNLKKAD